MPNDAACRRWPEAPPRPKPKIRASLCARLARVCVMACPLRFCARAHARSSQSQRPSEARVVSSLSNERDLRERAGLDDDDDDLPLSLSRSSFSSRQIAGISRRASKVPHQQILLQVRQIVLRALRTDEHGTAVSFFPFIVLDDANTPAESCAECSSHEVALASVPHDAMTNVEAGGTTSTTQQPTLLFNTSTSHTSTSPRTST